MNPAVSYKYYFAPWPVVLFAPNPTRYGTIIMPPYRGTDLLYRFFFFVSVKSKKIVRICMSLKYLNGLAH